MPFVSLRARIAALVFILLAVSALTAQDKPLWAYKTSQDIKFQWLHSTGYLLVGTQNEVVCLDPETGAVRWKRTDLPGLTDDRLDEVDGTTIVLVNATDRLHAVNIEDGKSVWQTDKIKGSTVGVLPILEKNFVLLLTTDNPRKGKLKPDMLALNLETGAPLWQVEFADNVDLHEADNTGRFMPRRDLSGHQPPIYDDDSIYFTYAGIHRYEIATGKVIWKTPYDVTEGNLKRANAQAVLDRDTVYTSAKGVIRAIDRATGAIKWTSSDFGAAVAQMQAGDKLIFGRMGGTYFDHGKDEWLLKKPLGVVAVNKNTGQQVWRFDDAKDSITNMLIVPQQHMLLIADMKELIALDTESEGKIKEALRIKLEFKHKIGGGAKAARAGLKFARGGLMGLGKKDKSDFDAPITISMRGNGLAVVQGKQHLLAFNPQTKSIAWSTQFEAPGSSAWQKYVWAAITAAGYGANFGMASNTQLGSSVNTAANQGKNMFAENYEKILTRRYSATRGGANFTYVLTKVEEGKDQVPGIVGVNLDNGEAIHQVALGDKDPNYQVDEGAGRIFNIKDKKELVAYTIR